MNISFFYNPRSQYDPTNISLFAVPHWLEVTLKAQGKRLDAVWSDDPRDFLNILSSRDVQLHEDISCAVEEYLFGTHKYGASLEEARKHLEQDWFLIPFTEECELNLHPVILGSNLIGLVSLSGEEAKRVCETDIYERLLRCYHKLAVAQLGTKVWQAPLAQAILKRIQSASQVA